MRPEMDEDEKTYKLTTFKKKSKSVTSNPPEESIPATKADINNLINTIIWPPAFTRNEYGLRMQKTHKQIQDLVNTKGLSATNFTHKFNDLSMQYLINSKNFFQKEPNMIEEKHPTTTTKEQQLSVLEPQPTTSYVEQPKGSGLGEKDGYDEEKKKSLQKLKKGVQVPKGFFSNV